MNIILINDDTIATGKAAFAHYRTAVMCGSTAISYDRLWDREIGLETIPGAIIACIENSMTTKDEIINAAARVSHCRRTTVEAVLESLIGSLWRTNRRGDYEILSAPKDEDGGSTKILLAA